MVFSLSKARLRSWQMSDTESLARYANNRKIWRNVRDRFPHPYTLADAEAYISTTQSDELLISLAIEVGGEAVGCVSLKRGQDVARLSAEIGFWLGEPFWGRGIITEAMERLVEEGFDAHGLQRIYAYVFEWNLASSRTLVKAGFVQEGCLRRSAIKDGQIIDQYLFARITQD